MARILKIAYLFSLILFNSCSQRNLAYFSDLESKDSFSNTISTSETKIQPDDILSITISSLNAESNAMFNNGVLTNADNSDGGATSNNRHGHLVDKKGEINFPVIGKIKLAGLTKEEASEKIESILKTKYIKNPIVSIQFINFKVTVLGEVNSPSTFSIPEGKVNILEALALAGDMTSYGKRENVLIIREKQGIKTTTRISLNNKDILSSPLYYLQQNDVIYVEPDKAKTIQASSSRSNITLALSIISVLSVILTRII